MPCRVPGILGWGRCVDSFGLNGLVFSVSIPCFLSPVVSAVDDGWWYTSRVVEIPFRLGWVSFFCVCRVVHLHGWRPMCHGWYETTQLAIHLTTHHRGLPEDAFCHRVRSFLVFLLCLGSHASFPLPPWFRLDPIPRSWAEGFLHRFVPGGPRVSDPAHSNHRGPPTLNHTDPASVREGEGVRM